MLQQLRANIAEYFKKKDLTKAVSSASSLIKALDSEINSKKKEIEFLHALYAEKQKQLSNQLPQNDQRLLKAEGEDVSFLGRIKFELLDKFERFEEDHLQQLFNLHKQIQKLDFMKSMDLEDQVLSYKEFIQNPDNVSLKYQQYMKNSLGRERSSMPQVDADDIDKFLIHFSKMAKVTPCKLKLSDIRPCQGEMDDTKVMDKMANDEWKKRKYIVSKDNYLIDGHHSWAGGLENDPDYEVECYKVNLTAKELLRRTNLLKISRKENLDGTGINKAAVYEGLSEKEVDLFCKAFDQYLIIRENEIEQMRTDEMWQNISGILTPELRAYNQSIEQIFE